MSAAGCAQPELTCNDPLGCIEVAANEPVKLGYLLAMSGPAAFLGVDSLGGIELAIDERNGELLGHQLNLTGADSGCTAVQGETAAATMMADLDLIGIIGPNCSTAAAAAIPTINSAGSIMISPSSTSAALTDPNTTAGGQWREGFFRTAYNTRWQGSLAAEFLYDTLGARTAGVIYDEQNYPIDGLPRTFTNAFQALGGRIVLERAVAPGQTNFADALGDMTRTRPDVVYLAVLQPEAQWLLNGLAETDELENFTFMAPDSLFSPGFISQGGTAVTGMYISGPAVTDPAYETFLNQWQLKYNAAPTGLYHAHAYDAANLLLDTVTAVAQIGSNNTLLIGRQALRDALSSTAGYKGLTGALNCQNFGECASVEALGIYQLTNDTSGLNVWPPELIWSPALEVEESS